MDKDQELRGWKAHCVELQGRVDRLESEVARLKSAWHQDVLSRKDALIAELEAEKDVLKSALSVAGKANSRLQSVIDAANAQEPISNVDVYYDWSDSGKRILTWANFGSNFKSLGVGKHKLYARPIPAQQSIEQAHMAGQADAGVDPSYSNAHSYAISAQQSQAVAVPDGGKLAKLFSDFEFMATGNGFDVTRSSANTGYQCRKTAELFAAYSDGWGSGFDFGFQSPRITEQDAREIAQSAVEYYSDHGWREGDKFWMQNKGLSLLNKLNEAKNG